MSLHSSQQDHALLCAWRKGIAEASKHADNAAQRLRCREPELLPAFTSHYQNLQALSRRTRRRLQRRWKHSLAALALLADTATKPFETSRLLMISRGPAAPVKTANETCRYSVLRCTSSLS
jgi:hypothetical protein